MNPHEIDPSLAAILSDLPSVAQIKASLNSDEAWHLGVNESGDEGESGPVYKLLTKEGVMATYELVNGTLILVDTSKLHY